MKLSRRAKRMEQHHKRSKRTPGLSLVSLMDIFTILVFFLLVSSAEVQDIPSTNAVKLPESISLEKPRETLVVVVTEDDIIVQGETVATVLDALASDRQVIEPLKTALVNVAARSITATVRDDSGSPQQREVTIMGDRDIPYKLLKKIMASCTEANYNHISLAVVKKTNVDG